MDKAAQIRALNDEFRTQLRGGRLMLTRGIAGRPDTEEILRKVATFSEFSEDSDPFGEHDFGAFEHEKETILWKFDYYDRTLQAGSEDPSDPNITTRVLTIMLSAEY